MNYGILLSVRTNRFQSSRLTEENRRVNQSIVDLVTKFAEQKKATPAQVALA
jgi:aryl-alcohol dehydrogenase-like predicted oxidoreductase